MSTDDYARAAAAIAALGLTGPNNEVAGYWLSRWDNSKQPRMDCFNDHPIWKHAPAISAFEIREHESVRCIKGAAFVKLTAGFDFANQDVLSLTNAVDRDGLLAWMWQIASGAVSVYSRPYKSNIGSSGLAQGVALPFSDEHEGLRYFLTHTNWRPVGDEWVQGNVTIDLQIPSQRRVIGFMPVTPEAALI